MTDRDELFAKIQDALHAPCVKRWELLRQLGKDNESLTKHGANMHKDQAQEVFDAVWPEIERMGIAEAILRSEQFMWLMAGSNHIASHLRSIRPAFDKWIAKGGKSWGKV